MTEEERIARELVQSFGVARISARAVSERGHWRVLTGTVERSLEVTCYWHSWFREVPVATEGINQLRELAGFAVRPHRGAEYRVRVVENGRSVCDGRTQSLDQVLAAASAWLESGDLETVKVHAPFVGARREAMLPLTEALGTREWELGPEPAHILSVYGNGRSCSVVHDGSKYVCQISLGPVVVAQLNELQDLKDVVRIWLEEESSVTGLRRSLPGITIAPHADYLDTDAAKWHWLSMRTRIGDRYDVLWQLAPFLELVARSSIATRFYSFSSHFNFRFSSSSHYPWVTEGLPTIAPADQARHVRVDNELLPYDEALQMVETLLEAAPHEPFFGSSVDIEIREVTRALADRGSELRPTIVHRGGYPSLEVRAETRRCTFVLTSVEMLTSEHSLRTTWPSMDAAADAAIRFLEKRAPLEDFVGASELGIRPRRS